MVKDCITPFASIGRSRSGDSGDGIGRRVVVVGGGTVVSTRTTASRRYDGCWGATEKVCRGNDGKDMLLLHHCMDIMYCILKKMTDL